jgi:hypothetical protein
METINKNQKDCIKEIYEYGVDRLKDGYGLDCNSEDIHHELYNTDYFIVGTYEAKKFLESFGVFEAIEKVKDYEEFNFGESYTDYSNPEKLVNMLAYIVGEEMLQETEKLNEGSIYMDQEQINLLIEKLENL